ncbi:cytochrome ubiquinol oxidase subunit I [Cupriavidus oxalaticus]|uniref:Cytochrome ubiquinol oxidase subunit I n=1 Tax=Cupriavidus oxalaticus TaxID=96344 RepID=A0A375GR68_9BURK|nr:cytochrome ubiquinol oxidase subunit I [Cupriavidus oxalaticus]QRQ85454.1 cytochrome ubiquinol oxidase subunit I [Cupriavidus oxalaticus]QRQ90458.1 cytochrome ubiquinol oxidase subunit I [Cupriavidus oxalaticus]WQD84975.1 cytochrome ubiquinol oxidase subunit I [Cupriavidus oxalaticus]SPC08317.1 ubiquinol oxidase subunit I, cyanide insensitive [Cupriavidus oxalaticus]SPC24257.1 ubiquinol oxidase subunit I, cyanide insensitive [Cupriavidus oxalaticus]
MHGLTALDLARIQFGFTVSFHILFPAITIGLACFLAFLEARWLRTQDPVYRTLYQFWIKIFSINFGMGVVSGLVMAYEFGTNWSGFSQFAGGITGPLLTYEVLTAFFLEAGFLGVMLFGWNRVGPGLHFFSTVMVALGTMISSTWILASNSWMHTPAGYAIVAGKVVPTDWLEVIFNPSFPYRLAHMVIAALLSTALFVAASSAWQLLHGRAVPAARKMLSLAMWMVLITAPIQAMVGDAHGLNTLKHQPAKIAALEGHWNTAAKDDKNGFPLIVFGIPDMEREETRYAIEIPRLGSLILTHSLDGQIRGLKDFPKEDRPNATVLFFTFRVMVGLGVAMIAFGLLGWALRRNGALYRSKAFLRLAVAMGPTGLIALLAGWMTTEIGRQPWVVYGLQRTRDAVSAHAAGPVALSLALFVVVYFVCFGVGIRYMLKLASAGPAPDAHPHPHPNDRPSYGPGSVVPAAIAAASAPQAMARHGHRES